MDFPDPDTAQSPTTSGPRPPRGGRTRGSARQQILVRRAIAVGVGVLVLFLLVLGVRGCLDARQQRALENYARDLSSIMTESQAGGERFFTLLQDPGELTSLEYEAEVQSSRGEAETLLDRAEELDTPDEMATAQRRVELTLELRRDALATISERISTALGREGREGAVEEIADQMQTLLASDVIYRELARPEIRAALAEEGVEGVQVPRSRFLPDLTWLESDTVDGALGGVSGGPGAEPDDNLVHGLGLLQVALAGVVLEEGVPATVPAGGAPVLEVQVQNQGEAEESDVTVTVTVDGGTPVEESIDRIAPGETATVEVPLTDAPSGQATIAVEVGPVPGEEVEENNSAEYTVSFE